MFLFFKPYTIISIHFLLVLFVLNVSGQQKTDLSFILENETILRDHFISLQTSNNDAEKDSVNTAILEIFKASLTISESFIYTWPALDMIGKVKSEDMLVNIFTWHIQKTDNEYSYYGIIQHRIPGKKKEDIINVFLLNDISSSLENPETTELTSDTWYGALYYSIATHKHRKKTWYTLLGFDFNTNFSNKKLIEILHFDQNKPIFGAGIETGNDQVKRLIFEYSSDIVMSLRYDEKLQQIVFDHLSPIAPIFTGVHRFYVPDGSYNALIFKNGIFTLEKDVDARND